MFMQNYFYHGFLLFLLLNVLVDSFLIVQQKGNNLNHNVQKIIDALNDKPSNNYRFLQTVSVNSLSSSSFQQVENQIVSKLSQKRQKLGLQKLSRNIADQSTIQRWSNNFKTSYTLQKYLTLLKRYTKAKLMIHKGFDSVITLQQSMLKSLQNQISQSRLKQISIFMFNQDNKFNAFALLQNAQDSGEIQILSYSEQQNVNKAQIPSQIKIETLNSTNNSADKSNLTKNQASQQNDNSTKNQTIIKTEQKTISYKNDNPSPSIVNPKQNPNTTNNNSINSISNQQPSKNIIPNQIKLPTTTPPSNTLIYSISQVPNTKFNGIVLSHQIPTTFSNKELFQLRGTVNSPATTSDGTSINFILTNLKTNQRFAFNQWLGKDVKNFVFVIDFRKVLEGQYFLAIFQGPSGVPRSDIYRVVSQLPSNQINSLVSPLVPSNLTMIYEQNKLFVAWNRDNSTSISKIKFQQGKQSLQYILTNFQSKFQVPFKNFYKFKQGESVILTVSSAYSLSSSFSGIISQFSPSASKQFIPTKHHFSEFKQKQIVFTSQIPWIVNKNTKIVIKGRALMNLQNRILVQQPSKTFKQFFFIPSNKSATIASGTAFNLQIQFNQNGAHIFQINNIDGGASLNRPFYVGDSYPLVPDFNDLNQDGADVQKIINGQTTILSEQRSIMLKLINEKRRQYNVNQIVEDFQLNRFAQAYSDDMVNRNFYGHYNLEGQGVAQRAKKFNINFTIGQNVARNINFTDAHYRLCRSPIHLQNIVKKQWTRLGLGISRNSYKYFFVVQEFGGRDFTNNPLTSNQISQIKNQLVSFITSSYSTVKSENIGLSNSLSDWQNLPSNVQNSQSIVSYVNSKGFRNFSLGNIRVFYTPEFFQNIKGTKYLQPDKPNATQVGITLKLVNGWVQIFFAYL